MTDREIDYGVAANAVGEAIEQRLKGVHTGMPGVVVSYDAARKRAVVQPAIDLLIRDGSSKARARAVNVPVVWPTGGGFTQVFPLPAGEPVWLAFSERGLTRFKQTFRQAAPDRNRLFDESDAVAMAGFGRHSGIVPASEAGSSWQAEDGATYVTLEQGRVEINARLFRVMADRIEFVKGARGTPTPGSTVSPTPGTGTGTGTGFGTGGINWRGMWMGSI